MPGFDEWDELGPPEIRPVPEGRGRRKAAIVASAVAVLVLGLGVAVATRGGGDRGRGGGPSKDAQASAPTTITESFTVTASGAATSTIVTPTPGATSTAPAVRQPVRATKVAYRQDGALWVAEESGAGPQRVVASAAGAFSLAPDGKTLAFVDAAAKTLALADVDTGRVTTVGPAEVREPVWSPLSDWLAFTNAGEVRRVQSDGSRMRFLAKGTNVAVGPSGRTLAYATGAGITFVDENERPTRISVKGRVDDLALGADRLFYSVGGASRSAMALHSVRLDGKDDKQLAGGPSDPEAGMYDELTLSPDGSRLAFAVTGDDLHSRLRAMTADGTLDTSLSLRRDDYLIKWSADGTSILFIDGNKLQGETTQLMSVHPDGSTRLTILRGAGI